MFWKKKRKKAEKFLKESDLDKSLTIRDKQTREIFETFRKGLNDLMTRQLELKTYLDVVLVDSNFTSERLQHYKSIAKSIVQETLDTDALGKSIDKIYSEKKIREELKKGAE